MDQVKIGKFISNERKAKGYTQKQLSELLAISDKTISKWECGNGFPEASLLLPLCNELEITVNELLTGERISQQNYKKKAEEMHRKAGAAGYAPSASRFGAAWPDAARVLGLTAAEAREQARTRRRAAVEGYASEQYNLGVMYQTGFGLPKDMAKAREWFQKAADQGDVQAKSVLKKLR